MDTDSRSTTLTLESEITGLKVRLARAESDRTTWRVAGMPENYLACSRVDALARQLDQLEGSAKPSAGPCVTYPGYRYDRFAEAANYARLDRSRPFADSRGDDGAPLERTPAPTGEERALMRTLGITFADGVFHWRHYRYERLDDAVAYARHEQARENGEGSRSLTLRRR